MYISDFGLTRITSIKFTKHVTSFIEYREKKEEVCNGIITIKEAGYYYKNENGGKPTKLPTNMINVNGVVKFKPGIVINESGPTHSAPRQLYYDTIKEAEAAYTKLITKIPGNGLII